MIKGSMEGVVRNYHDKQHQHEGRTSNSSMKVGVIAMTIVISRNGRQKRWPVVLLLLPLPLLLLLLPLLYRYHYHYLPRPLRLLLLLLLTATATAASIASTAATTAITIATTTTERRPGVTLLNQFLWNAG